MSKGSLNFQLFSFKGFVEQLVYILCEFFWGGGHTIVA